MNVGENFIGKPPKKKKGEEGKPLRGEGMNSCWRAGVTQCCFAGGPTVSRVRTYEISGGNAISAN